MEQRKTRRPRKRNGSKEEDKLEIKRKMKKWLREKNKIGIR